MSLDIDFISLSPSLVDVLQLIDHPDVLKCRLVSRRFDDVIRRHSIRMRRPEADIQFLFGPDAALLIKVFVRNPEWERHASSSYDNMHSTMYYFRITDETLRLGGCKNQSIRDHFLSTNQQRTDLPEESEDGKGYKWEQHALNFHSRGVREELRSTLSIILRTYNIHQLWLPNDTEKSQASVCADILDLLCEQSKEQLCKVMHLRAVDHCNWLSDSQLQKALQALDPHALGYKLSTNNLSFLLPLCTSFKRLNNIMFYTSSKTFDSLQPLVDLVESWSSEKMFYGVICFWSEKEPFLWTMQKIAHSFSHLPGFRCPTQEERRYAFTSSGDHMLAVIEKAADKLIFIEYDPVRTIFDLQTVTVEFARGQPNVYKRHN